MKSYQYIARDLAGVRKEGYSQAACANDVLGWLRQQGLTPVSINELAAVSRRARRKPLRRRIKSADLSSLCWQLTTMVEGGISITTALDTISEDIENVQLQKVMRRLSEKMQKGESLSDSITEFPNVFNRLSRAIILAGETGGSLPLALRRVAEYFDNRDKLGKKLKAAMAYPIFAPHQYHLFYRQLVIISYHRCSRLQNQSRASCIFQNCISFPAAGKGFEPGIHRNVLQDNVNIAGCGGFSA